MEQNGDGDFTWGYFGGLLDTATGLIYVGGGQYYDPATGRFLTRQAQPGAVNPYIPARGNPLGALMAPLGLLFLLHRRRKKGKYDRLLIGLVLLLSLGMGLAACDGVPPEDIPSSPHPPTNPPGDSDPGTSLPNPTDTPLPPSPYPTPTPTPTCTPSPIPPTPIPPTPTPPDTLVGQFNMSAYYITLESEYSGKKVPIPSAHTKWANAGLYLSSTPKYYWNEPGGAQMAKEDFLYEATGLCYQGSGKLENEQYISCVTHVDWTGIASVERRRAFPDIEMRQPAKSFIGFEWGGSKVLSPFETVAVCTVSKYFTEGDTLIIPELQPYLRQNGGSGVLEVTDRGGALCKSPESIDLYVGEGNHALGIANEFFNRANLSENHPDYIPQYISVYKR